MKRLLLLMVMLVGVGIFAGKQHLERQAQDALDALSFAIYASAELSYGTVQVTHEGNLIIDDIAISPRETKATAFISRVEFPLHDFRRLFALERAYQKRQLPQELKVVFEGVQISTHAPLFADAIASVVSPLDLAGCGELSSLGSLEFAALGMGTIQGDVTLEYRRPTQFGAGLLSALVQVTNVADLRAELHADLGAELGNWPALKSAWLGANLKRVSLQVDDQGWQARLRDFCRGKMGLSADAYREHHLEAWEQRWQRWGLVSGPNMLREYTRYTENPRHLYITATPINPLKVADLWLRPLDQLVYDLTVGLRVNGAEVVYSDVIPEAKAQALRAEAEARAEQAKPTLTSTPSPSLEGLALSEDNAEQLLGQRVTLQLTSGKHYEGKLVELTKRRVSLERTIGRGVFVMPIAVEEIESYRLLTEAPGVSP